MPTIRESTDIDTSNYEPVVPPASSPVSAPPTSPSALPAPQFVRGTFPIANPASVDNLNYFYSVNKGIPVKRLLPPPVNK
jgi:hypothetical protein